MSRNFVALAVLALAGAMFSLSEPAFAAGARGALPGFRAPMIRSPRAILQHRPFALPRAQGHFGHHRFGHHGHHRFGHRPLQRVYGAQPIRPPFHNAANHGFARRTLGHPRAHLARRHHKIYHSGWVFPITVGETAFIGTAYDPVEAIPVYGPEPAVYGSEPAAELDPPATPAAPRLSNVRDENAEGCRSERVTVPASEGEREITVVRC